MCRGCFSSCKYSATCWSESWRPNQVFHQNRTGMSTISHAVRKKSSRLRADMRGRRLAGGMGFVSASDEDCGFASGTAAMDHENIAESAVRVSGPWKVGTVEHHYQRVSSTENKANTSERSLRGVTGR